MKKTNDIVIIGSGITGLYAGIMCIELGYNVIIVEKKYYYGNIINNNIDFTYDIYNNNHKSYINLLKKFNISSTLLKNNNNNNVILNIINNVIERSKNIPNNILLSYTFYNLCKQFISQTDIDELSKEINNFIELFNTISALDAINMFKNDINNNLQYYKTDTCINDLIKKMIDYYISKGGNLINNVEIVNLTYSNKKFILYTNINYTSYTSDIIISTISNDNLLSFKFWSKEQIKYLNSVNSVNLVDLNKLSKLFNWYDESMFKNFSNDIINEEEHNIRDVLLNSLHIVYPVIKNKNKKIYFWKQNINSIIYREKIKNIYNNNFFICGDSYSKKRVFINYSLETIDNILPKLINKSF